VRCSSIVSQTASPREEFLHVSISVRLFDVAGGSLTLQDLKLQGGLAQGTGVAADGWVVYSSGILTLTSVTVPGNEAQVKDKQPLLPQLWFTSSPALRRRTVASRIGSSALPVADRPPP
jgi:hypothetical protein